VCVCDREGGRGRETESDRQTDRERTRERGGETDRHTDRQRECVSERDSGATGDD
jgi:hypothetical protein